MASATREPKIVVYKATNLIDGKYYIGVTKQGLAARKRGHMKDVRLGKGHRFHNAIRKYGEANFAFEVLHDFGDDYELALIYEHEMICKHRPEYNLTSGGEGGVMHESTKARLRAINLGRKASLETRAKMAAAQTGRPPTKGRTGQPVPLETREKIRRTLRQGRWADTPARIASRARTGTTAAREARKIPVVCLDDQRAFESILDAAIFYGLHPSKLAAAVREQRAIKGKWFERQSAATQKQAAMVPVAQEGDVK